MTALLVDPDSIRAAIINAYGYLDDSRAVVIQKLITRLDERGSIGTIARYYIIRCEYRRATLRRVLASLHLRIPRWLQCNRAAAEANRQFIAQHRATYNQWRAQRRQNQKKETND